MSTYSNCKYLVKKYAKLYMGKAENIKTVKVAPKKRFESKKVIIYAFENKISLRRACKLLGVNYHAVYMYAKRHKLLISKNNDTFANKNKRCS